MLKDRLTYPRGLIGLILTDTAHLVESEQHTMYE